MTINVVKVQVHRHTEHVNYECGEDENMAILNNENAVGKTVNLSKLLMSCTSLFEEACNVQTSGQIYLCIREMLFYNNDI